MKKFLAVLAVSSVICVFGEGLSGSNFSTAQEDYRRGFQLLKKRKYVEALSYFRKSAERGYTAAHIQLGLCYDYGNGVKENKKEAVKWYRKAAEQGEAVAQNILGICYADGRGVAKNYKEAVKWFRKAAEQGFAAGQRELGLCYVHGRGVAKDQAEALKWLRKAAEQKDEFAKKALKALEQ